MHLDKRIENRTWKPPQKLIGQRIAIHAGKSIGGRPGAKRSTEALRLMSYEAVFAGWEIDYLAGSPWRFRRVGHEMYCVSDKITTGAIVATATLAECSKDFYALHDGQLLAGPEEEITSAPCIQRIGWQAEGQYHWFLEDILGLEEPIPIAGKQGFWEVPHGLLSECRES
jgi:hypothetical protein